MPSQTRPVLIDNIVYEFNSAKLSGESLASLDELVAMLQQNANVTGEIGAHCDYRGRNSYNEKLSQARAESAVEYLIKQGIEQERLTPVGYGEEEPKVVTKKLAERYPFLKEDDVFRVDKIKAEELCKDQTVQIFTAACGIISAAVIAYITCLRYKTYSAPNYDFGIFCQMFHYMKTTGLPMVTCERNELLSHFAVHISPIYYILLPFYYIFPSPLTLQIGQAVVLAS